MSNKETGLLALLLIAAAVVLHWLHYLVFGDAHHILIYLLGDIAFVPLEVLFVTVIVDRLLSERERRGRQHKMNMVIGVFFETVGCRLLTCLGGLVTNREELCSRLAVTPDWTEQELRQALAFVTTIRLEVAAEPEALDAVRSHLVATQEFMLRLLENPMVLEHDTFADLLWAIFHLGSELSARRSLSDLADADLRHLAGDTNRAYSSLLAQWIAYMIHLRQDYPYLFSFAARTNPLRPDAHPEIG